VHIMLNEQDQYKLRQRSSWDEDTRDWTIPLFILNKIQDEVAFPTIGAKARVQQAKDERTLLFAGERASEIAPSRRNHSSSKYDRSSFSDEHGPYQT